MLLLMPLNDYALCCDLPFAVFVCKNVYFGMNPNSILMYARLHMDPGDEMSLVN